MYNETLGKVHFWLTVVFFNILFLPLFKLGTLGQHRRIADYSNFPSLNTAEMQQLRIVATVALIGLFLTQFIWVYNMIHSFLKGKAAEKNPYNANTLEWLADSPPPHGNFEVYPDVYRGPYEYSRPDAEDDWTPQNLKPETQG